MTVTSKFDVSETSALSPMSYVPAILTGILRTPRSTLRTRRIHFLPLPDRA